MNTVHRENKSFTASTGTPPIIVCQWREDFDGGLKFYCPYCKKWHLHGRGEGHRAAHCHNEASPYQKTGYILKEPKTGAPTTQ